MLQNKTKDKNFSIFHAWNVNFNAREQSVHTSAVKFMCVGSLKLSTRINESKALFPKHFIQLQSQKHLMLSEINHACEINELEEHANKTLRLSKNQ